MAGLLLKQTSELSRIASAGDVLRPNNQSVSLSAESWKSALTPELLIEWRELDSAACEPNPFYESWHLPAALEAFDPLGAIEIILFRQDGRLCGLLPLERTNSYYRYPIPHLRGWLHDNAFCGVPLVRAGSEAAFWHALPQWASANSSSALFLHLSQLPEDGRMFSALRENITASNGIAAIAHRQQRALLSSDLSPDEYLAGAMSGKKRKELRRQFNRLSELGEVEFARQSDSEGLGGWTNSFLALENAGWKGREKSALASNPQTEHYFRNSLRGAADAEKLERLTLSLDGQPIAMLVNFLTPPGAFSFKTAFDEDYSRFSPGVLLQRENLTILDRDDIDWTDSCAAADHPMIERIWREKRTVVRVNIGIGGPLRRTAFRHLVRSEKSAVLMGDG